MNKAKRLVTAALVMLFLGSLAGCILVDRGGYGRQRNYSYPNSYRDRNYGYPNSYRDRDGDRR
jgi:hypothetical protein